MSPRREILVFVRYPEPGRVKTRLAAGVGDRAAARLYRAFVEDVLAVCRSTSHPLTVLVSEPDALDNTRRWLGGDHAYGAQEGSGLGERMSMAFQRAFERGCGQAVLIGSDIPDLPADRIEESFEALGSADAVIGPSGDGGYYLIGFRSRGFRRAVFQGVAWSAPSVFWRTCGLLVENGLSFRILPPWDDVDTVDDLERLWERTTATAGAPRARAARSGRVPGERR
ncbi:MAG: TIGR04282 family arsenosugar biosynthesis glycosyltransferase [Syntrophobacteraceae bacterium]|jgi:hypothetical protein|nr:TIGR04282 family arsenosugar biosynthesis glycosyltransferase [Syntrophobacteraceae bacterium]